jgi:hypothetical protein
MRRAPRPGDRTGPTTTVPAIAPGARPLMEIALQFEASHFAQIRRHYETITPEPDDDRWQLDLFGEHQPF